MDSCGVFFVLAIFYCSVMTILPKKKHSESKKTDTTSNSDNRARIRGNSSWSSSTSVTERNRSSEEYSGLGEEQYLGNSFESREAADVASSSSKRRHRSPPHRHKYHERHNEETGYNSSDEHDCTQEQPLSSEEVRAVVVFISVEENTRVLTLSFMFSSFHKGGKTVWAGFKGKERFCYQENGARWCLFISGSRYVII